MELVEYWLTELAHLVELGAILILFYAALLAVVRFFADEISTHLGKPSRGEMIRFDLGARMLFALELMIASDIVQTVVSRTMDDLIFLAILVVIRTVISFFLGREIREIRESADAR